MTNRRRRTAAVKVILLVTVTVLVAAACRSERESRTASVVQVALAKGASADRFRFVYNANGTKVNDCFEPNRSFVGDVDLGRGLLVLRRDLSSPPVAFVTGGRAVLSASLFRKGSHPTSWLRTPGLVDGPLRTSLLRALGTGLGGYVVDGQLPPDGTAFARDGLEVAKEVTQLRDRDGAQGFALTLDRNAFPAASDPDDESLLGDPILEFWIGASGDVRRVTVRPGRVPGYSEEDLEVGGWTIDYLPPSEELAVPDLGPMTELGPGDARTIAAPPIETCELPLSTNP